jgi:hypothetical protein
MLRHELISPTQNISLFYIRLSLIKQTKKKKKIFIVIILNFIPCVPCVLNFTLKKLENFKKPYFHKHNLIKYL